MIGTITLNPSIDQHMLVERLDKDDTNRAKQILETPGGKGINVSKVMREAPRLCLKSDIRRLVRLVRIRMF